MIEYCRGKKEEFEDIIDFANYIFSQNVRPHDFKSLLPKLYADGKNSSEYHYLAKENGKIRAMVCAQPLEHLTPGAVLKAACIGMVSVHPYERGKGYMKELMHLAIEDLKAAGCAYLFLGGQRQRYEYFGFERAGLQLDFTVTAANIRHCFKDIDLKGTELVPLTEETMLDKAYACYETQPYRMKRSREDFHSILCSWESIPYAILQQERFGGYVVIRSDGTVTELLLTETELYPYVLKALFSSGERESRNFLFSPAEKEKTDFFLKIAETWRLSLCENCMIVDWAAVLEAFLCQKAEYERLPEGEVILGIDAAALKITVNGNKPFVCETSEEVDLAMSALEATALCFSGAGEYLLNKYTSMLTDEKYTCVYRWFPLPLMSPQNDCC